MTEYYTNLFFLTDYSKYYVSMYDYILTINYVMEFACLFVTQKNVILFDLNFSNLSLVMK